VSELRRVLFVDDQPDMQMVARVALAQVGGFEVEICGSGGAALEKVSEFEPDLILLDVRMPGMDGPETLAELRARPESEAIPVVFLTGDAQPDDVERLLALGAVDVLAKPFDPMTLADEVRAVWQRARG
jgi:CheY-like chemotaxis protein